ncbi:MAG: hypothetical protein Q7U10_04155 [Thermodesulfovibrionia bacterium]|nr:hypothetical protein [Thermodesulfovibrionia bacterium]
MICSRNRKESGFSIIFLVISITVVCLAIFAFCAGGKFLADMHAKNVVQWCRKWESAELAYYFKRDKLAGDKNGNGIIADEGNPDSPVMELIGSKVISESMKKIEEGDSTFYITIGFNTIKNRKKNVFVICPSAKCDRTLNKDEAAMMEKIDKIMDGDAIASEGNLKGAAGVTLVSEGAAVTDVREEMTSADWKGESFVGAVYYFEDSGK